MNAPPTPGPWNVGEDGDVFSHDVQCVARIVGAPEGSKEANANARLIAAAPDMLFLLQRIAEDLQNGRLTHCDGSDVAVMEVLDLLATVGE